MADSPGDSTRLKLFKSYQEEDGISVDRISNLPDALLHQILSFLPTKTVVATSVLSKRWVSVWTSVPALDFQDSDICRSCPEAMMNFMEFVYNTFLLNKSGSIERFRLHCNLSYGLSCVNKWICFTVNRGMQLQEVDIAVSKAREDEDEDSLLLKLPSGFFLMKTLKILKLEGDIMFDFRGPISLPSLKILHLRCVNYATNTIDSLVWVCGSPGIGNSRT
ncbi:hypothetical protein CCACVL1_13046 [Corchorus capsularis]|uniref:F-box domain-containing protein n=1 Tax=Corchorus capsularis TaxID=210143 RepID=A0A1R3ICM4_COCAP|nr:hypothetical protein CCACVL1_13046 [Corchorus capsularis]